MYVSPLRDDFNYSEPQRAMKDKAVACIGVYTTYSDRSSREDGLVAPVFVEFWMSIRVHGYITNGWALAGLVVQNQ
jgi:hypothetical protein